MSENDVQSYDGLTKWENKKREKRRGYLIRFGAVLIWGIQPLYIKYTPVSEVPTPVLPVFIGIGMAAVSILILLVLRGIGKKKFWKPNITVNFYLINIIISLTLFYYLLVLSLSLTSGTNFILLNNFSPIFALLVAIIFWRNEIPYLKERKQLFGMLFVFSVGGLGGALVLWNSAELGNSSSFRGDLFAILTMMVDVLLVVCQIRYAKYLKDNQSTFLNFYLGIALAVLLSPFLFIHSEVLINLPLTPILWALSVGAWIGLGLILNAEAFRRMDGFIAFLMFNISVLITFTAESYFLKKIEPTLLLILGGSLIIGASIMAEAMNSRCEKKELLEES